MTGLIEMASHSASTVSAPRVRIVTDLGDIVVELYPDRAPRSAGAFLAEVAAGSFDAGSFNRIVRAVNDQGSPTIEVIQGSSREPECVRADVQLEGTANTGLHHEDGTISLPRRDGGLGTAQSFFLCIGPQPALDAGGGRTIDGGGFAAFGRVVAGMEVVRAIHRLPTQADAPTDYLKGQMAAAAVAIHRIHPEGEAPAGRLSIERSAALFTPSRKAAGEP